MDQKKKAAYRAFNRAAQSRAFENETMGVRVYTAVAAVVVAVVVVLLVMALSGVQQSTGIEPVGVFTSGPPSAR